MLALAFSSHHQTRARPVVASASATRVVALDFDGVICDSEPELTLSAWKAASELWPEIMTSAAALDPKEAGARRSWVGGQWSALQGERADGLPNWLAVKMRLLRPCIETGYESVLMMRLCADEALSAAPGKRPLTPGEITSNWDRDLRDTLLARYGLREEEAIERYAVVRDAWLESDEDSWLAANKFYDGAVEALRSAVDADEDEIYIVTTKQQRFAQALLRGAGIDLPDDRVFGLGSGPKAKVSPGCHHQPQVQAQPIIVIKAARACTPQLLLLLTCRLARSCSLPHAPTDTW